MTSPTSSCDLFAPPTALSLPLSLGGDLNCNFIYKPLVVDGSGNPILDVNGKYQFAVANYPSGATVTLTIGDSDITLASATATITNANAVVNIPHIVTDTIPHNVLWRVVLTYTSGVSVVMANGRILRKDGKNSGWDER